MLYLSMLSELTARELANLVDGDECVTLDAGPDGMINILIEVNRPLSLVPQLCSLVA